jgi:outer membrane protein assembly factor BamB
MLKWIHIFRKTSLTLASVIVGGLITLPVQAAILVSNFGSLSNPVGSSVLEYDETTGEFLGNFVAPGSGGLTNANGLLIAPNGNLLVSDWATGSVLEYDGTTGEFIRTFVSPGSGGLSNPVGLLFGSNGNLLVNSFGTGNVLEYDEETGEFVRTFIPAGSGGLDRPVISRFASNDNLLVGSWGNGSILEYDGQTGEFIRTFVSPGSGGLTLTEGFSFSPNGNLFVNSSGSSALLGGTGLSAVLEYDGQTGEFLRTFIPPGLGGLNNPTGLLFTPEGDLLISSYTSGTVLEYDGTTGEFLGTFASSGNDGLTNPTQLIFVQSSSAVPIPEPASGLATLAFGALLAIWILKKKRKIYILNSPIRHSHIAEEGNFPVDETIDNTTSIGISQK